MLLALSKLYYLYAIDTSCLYFKDESDIEHRLWELRNEKRDCREADRVSEVNCEIAELKKALVAKFEEHKDDVRQVDASKLKKKNVVSMFDSALTRTLGLREREINDELFIIRIYYFQILRSILDHGFGYNGKNYEFFSASAGQIRTKKLFAVRSDLLREHWNSLTCGITVDDVNAGGGLNVNKWLAYLSLISSATDEIKDFDIDRCIVIDDVETLVRGEVDYIDKKKFTVTRQVMDVPINFSDGIGFMLPGAFNNGKNFMVRLPFLKGLLAVFDFKGYIAEKEYDTKITDIYGKTWDIVDDDIQVIFTKSQLKLHKFFPNWEDYKKRFKEYGCSAGRCNEEEDRGYAKYNYQFLQTLTDFTDDELKQLCRKTDFKINNVCSNIKTMLDVFGAYSLNPNWYQKCLKVYPELVQDEFSRETLRELRRSMENAAWAGRLEIDGKYEFIVPDPLALFDVWFGHKEGDYGCLNAHEVSCRAFSEKKLAMLRSPHLYREYPIMENKIKDDTYKRWLTTDALYLNIKDLSSKIVQCDFDGDCSCVVAEDVIVNSAERNNAGIVPLYYEMGKAAAIQINSSAIYENLIFVYVNANIGVISNNISKIWNKDEVNEKDLNTIKILTALTNYTIDAAKTLELPVLPPKIAKEINKIENQRLPHFFKFAKQKGDSQIIRRNASVTNRLRDHIKRRRIKFDASVINGYDYHMLMGNRSQQIDLSIIGEWKRLTKTLNGYMFVDGDKRNNYQYLYDDVRNKMLAMFPASNIVDVIIQYYFGVVKSKRKVIIYEVWGDKIYENLCRNLRGTGVCRRCGKRFVKRSNSQTICNDCAKIAESEYKHIACSVCGINMKVTKWAKTSMCPDCYAEYRRNYVAQKKQQQRQMSTENPENGI